MTIYHQAAHASSTRICQILEQIITEELIGGETKTDEVVNIVIFVGRLCHYMSLSSCIRGLCYRIETAQGGPVVPLVCFLCLHVGSFPRGLECLA